MSNRKQMRAAVGTMAVAVALAATAAPMQAQQPPREGPRHGHAERGHGPMQDPAARIDMRVRRLTEELALSTDQAAQVRTALERQQQAMRAFMEQHGFTPGEPRERAERTQPDSAQRAAFRAQMQQLHADTDATIEGILNAEQRQKYDALRERMRERVGERPRRGPRSGGR